jgi:hypothetical protein
VTFHEYVQLKLYNQLDSLKPKAGYSSGSIFYDSLIEQFYDHFWYLSRDRPIHGFSGELLVIPSTNIINYAKLMGIENVRTFLNLMISLDNFFLSERKKYIKDG